MVHSYYVVSSYGFVRTSSIAYVTILSNISCRVSPTDRNSNCQYRSGRWQHSELRMCGVW